MSKKEETKEEIVKTVRLDYVIPDDLIPRYATNMVVQHDEHQFTISFFEVRRPIVLGDDARQREIIETITSVRANCVAQIIVSPGKMKDFITALQTNFERYEEKNSADGSNN